MIGLGEERIQTFRQESAIANLRHEVENTIELGEECNRSCNLDKSVA
jgi:hypothetical protein